MVNIILVPSDKGDGFIMDQTRPPLGKLPLKLGNQTAIWWVQN